jgi:UDP-sugar transporter A1/2/3
MADSVMTVTTRWNLSALSLGALCFQNGATPLVMRSAMTSQSVENQISPSEAVCSSPPLRAPLDSSLAAARRTNELIHFSPPLRTQVLVGEILKVILSLAILLYEGGSLDVLKATIKSEILGKPYDTLKLAIPALLYFVVNVCLQLSAANLPAAVFQVSYQGKTLVAAFLSVIMLQKRLKRAQWAAIAVMGLGLAVVQLSSATESKQVQMANAATQSFAFGMATVLTGVCCSAFAGIYFEKMMKTGTPPSMWVRNVQLASFSILIGFIQVACGHVFSAQTDVRPFLNGFSVKVWVMVIHNAVGGLLVAMVIKHADNILKGFACAAATVPVPSHSSCVHFLCHSLYESRKIRSFELWGMGDRCGRQLRRCLCLDSASSQPSWLA